MMHASRPRNRLIAQALYDMGVIEHYGRGIKRITDSVRNSRYNPRIRVPVNSTGRVTTVARKVRNS